MVVDPKSAGRLVSDAPRGLIEEAAVLGEQCEFSIEQVAVDRTRLPIGSKIRIWPAPILPFCAVHWYALAVEVLENVAERRRGPAARVRRHDSIRGWSTAFSPSISPIATFSFSMISAAISSG